MITLDTLRDALPDYARDLKLNLGSVLSPTGAPGLTERQIWAVALGAAEASRNPAFAACHRASWRRRISMPPIRPARGRRPPSWA